jgi:hypothetical protein
MTRSNAISRAGCLLVACLATTSASLVTQPRSEIGVASRASANPSLAAIGRFAVVVWSAATTAGVTDIYASTSRDGGRVFGAPVRVNRTPGDASVGGEQPPRVALVPNAGRDPSIVVVWTAKDLAGTRLLSARSNDGGQSFLTPVRVPGSESSGNRGWESIAPTRDGDVVALWLDHRDLPTRSGRSAQMTHAEHQHDASKARGGSAAAQTDGVARAQLSKLFFGRLSVPDSARALTGGVCYCCKTTVATGSDGSIHAAWRHVYPGNIRDIAFTMSADGGRTFAPPVRVSEDQWVIDGCPENGPAIAVDGGRRIHVVWPTLIPGRTATSEPTLGLFYATSRDDRQFTTRQRIPTEGVPRHPQIAVGSRGEIIVVWDEQVRGTRQTALGRGTTNANGTAQFVRQPIADSSSAVYPVVATADDAVIVAWTSGPAGQTKLRTERLAF